MAARLARYLARLALILGGLALSLPLAELGARLLSPAPAEELLALNMQDATPGLYSTHSFLGRVPTPGYRARWWSPSGEQVSLAINAEGLRAEPLDPARPGLLFLGDSFTMAAQVNAPDTFAQRTADRRGLASFNAGVDGYGTWQSLFRAMELLDRLPLQGVVLTLFLGNDLTDNKTWTHLHQVTWQPGQRLAPRAGQRGQPDAQKVPPNLSLSLLSHSVLWSAYRVQQNAKALQDPNNHHARRFRDELEMFTREHAPERTRLLAHISQSLRQLQEETLRREIPLWVAIAPPYFVLHAERGKQTLATFGLADRTPELGGPHAAVLATLHDLGISTCDLQPDLLQAEAAGDQPYLRFDGHWSAAGHAVVADALDRCMTQ